MTEVKTAYYARTGGKLEDFWTLLHPPYTAWNVSYAAIGAALAPSMNWPVLLLTLLAFFFGTGIASHALDELNGRPLKTSFTDRELLALAITALLCCFFLALLGSFLVSPWIFALAVLGSLLVAGYALEWANGLIHTDLGFAFSWGGFPVLVGFFAQTETITIPAILAAAAATLYSLAQRTLSTPARFFRRSTSQTQVQFKTSRGKGAWDLPHLLATWERPLKMMSWSIILLASGLLAMHFIQK